MSGLGVGLGLEAYLAAHLESAYSTTRAARAGWAHPNPKPKPNPNPKHKPSPNPNPNPNPNP